MEPASDQKDAELLDNWLREAGYSGAGFARVMDVSPETVSRWRNGHLEVPRYVRVYLDAMVVVRGVRDKLDEVLGVDFCE